MTHPSHVGSTSPWTLLTTVLRGPFSHPICRQTTTKGVNCREDEWGMDTAHVVWSQVASLSGFWDGSFENGKCGAGTMIHNNTESLG